MAGNRYDPTAIEAEWQTWWQDNATNDVDIRGAKNPYYVLMMFPYPSAEGLHVGNVYAFTGADIHGRFKRLQGYDVFEPMGFDAFGIHSENFALATNRHPAELIPSNIANFTRQLKMMGFMFDWRHAIDSTSPEYYKWTQWVFLQLFKAGFAYRDVKEVNWSPSAGTVVADEQVLADGTFERDGLPVERRKMPCWFFRISQFSERLLSNLDWIDWSEITKTAQRKWIGKNAGANIDFSIDGHQEKITVFTTRPDTIFGATFVVLAPEHPLVDVIAAKSQVPEIVAYREECSQKTEEERKDEDVDKSGVPIGASAINPVTGLRIPIYIADYVLMDYGTGAIMAVPNGDHRDFAFAKTYNLPIVPIIAPTMGDEFKAAYISGFDRSDWDDKDIEEAAVAVKNGHAAWSGPGRLINSTNEKLSLEGLEKDEAIATVSAWLQQNHAGGPAETFSLRDWGISRQRYWGPPIPIVYDENGEAHPVPEDQLPVMLPELTDFRPPGDGRGPLAKAEDWVKTTLPDGRPGTRETDVMDNFLDSAWYYLRYPSARDDSQAWNPSLISKWLPVDMYIGGNEHAVLHLMYTRFICMALSDAGVLKLKELPEMKDGAEPFRKFRAHGMLIKDGSKMSKSKGNVVNPDAFVVEHGADTLRTYLMFVGPYQKGGDFRDKDIQGIRRFLTRVHAMYYREDRPTVVENDALPLGLRVKTHQTIKKVTEDVEKLSYNTAIAALMELSNSIRAAEKTSLFVQNSFCLMIAPFAPHLAEDIWHHALGNESTVLDGKWPEYDPQQIIEKEVEVPVQINGKVRDRVVVASGATNDELISMAVSTDTVRQALANGATIARTIVASGGRLVNVVLHTRK